MNAGDAAPQGDDHTLTFELRWSIKSSLIGYITGMPDGAVTAEEPARVAGGVFAFTPAPGNAAADVATTGSAGHGTLTEPLRFAGGAILSGHGGMLRLELRNPHLERADARTTDAAGSDSTDPGPTNPHTSGWLLTIDDPHAPGERIPLAEIDRLVSPHDAPHDAPAVLRADGTRLTADGADLFLAGPYTEGTPLDDPELHPTMPATE